MMLRSFYLPLCRVVFPQYQGRQHYMHEFDPATPSMPAGFEDYIPMIVQLTKKAGVTEKVFVTIDEKIVKAGECQRKPGPHVDGCFKKAEPEPKPKKTTLREMLGEEGYQNFLNGPYGFNGGSWGHGHSGSGWNHTCNNVPVPRMPVIVAASVAACRVWSGCFDATPSDQGDLSHISDQLGAGEIVPANVGYLLGPDCIHESMMFSQDTQRQFIRLALPVGTLG